MLKFYKFLLASAFPIMVLVSLVVLYLVYGVVDPACLCDKSKLVIDHDGGADDAMAIYMALLYEKYQDGPKLIALTTTHGNVGEEQTYNNTQRILSVADRRNVPIFRGSSKALISGIMPDNYFGVDGLGDNVTTTYKAIPAEKQHAVFALIELSKKYKDKLVVVSLGSLTNIALAIRIDPDFVSRLSQLYVAAGNIYDHGRLYNISNILSGYDNSLPINANFTKPEFNAAMDVESYYIVVNSCTPDKLTLIPFSPILKYQKISNEWRMNVLGSIQTKIMQALNHFEQISFKSTSFWSLLDPSAMAVVLEENTVVEEALYSNNSIILCGESRGINTNYFTTIEKANARVIYRVNKEPYKKFLYNLFSSG